MLFAMSVVRGGDVENFQMTRGLLPGPTFAHLPAGYRPTSKIWPTHSPPKVLHKDIQDNMLAENQVV